jgi:hypothetical protein
MGYLSNMIILGNESSLKVLYNFILTDFNNKKIDTMFINICICSINKSTF